MEQRHDIRKNLGEHVADITRDYLRRHLLRHTAQHPDHFSQLDGFVDFHLIHVRDGHLSFEQVSA